MAEFIQAAFNIISVVIIGLRCIQLATAIRCIQCEGEYNEMMRSEIIEHPCFAPSIGASAGSHNKSATFHSIECGNNIEECVLEYRLLNNALATVKRMCTPNCVNGCKVTGFAVTNIVCKICCKSGDLCNSLQAHSPESTAAATGGSASFLNNSNFWVTVPWIGIMALGRANLLARDDFVTG